MWRPATHHQLEAIIRLALDLGMRRDEIFRAELDDIHPDNAYVVRENLRARIGQSPVSTGIHARSAERSLLLADTVLRSRVKAVAAHNASYARPVNANPRPGAR